MFDLSSDSASSGHPLHCCRCSCMLPSCTAAVADRVSDLSSLFGRQNSAWNAVSQCVAARVRPELTRMSSTWSSADRGGRELVVCGMLQQAHRRHEAGSRGFVRLYAAPLCAATRLSFRWDPYREHGVSRLLAFTVKSAGVAVYARCCGRVVVRRAMQADWI